MIIENTRLVKRLTETILSHAEKQYDDYDRNLFHRFIKLYYSQASFEDLSPRSISDLYGLVLAHWQLARHRAPNELKIDILNPTQDINHWQSEHTILQVMTNDAPFLVDSIRMEIERFGITTHLMIYMGGMQVKRDQAGNIIDIDSYQEGSPQGQVEAPIYFEIDCLKDSKLLSELTDNIGRIINDVNSVVDDWLPLCNAMQESIKRLQTSPPIMDESEISETIDFLKWLMADNFTYLGKRDYVVTGCGDEISLQLVTGSGLGVLKNEATSKSKRYFSELPVKARRQMLSGKNLLVISQTNTCSTVHRCGYTAYIGIKQFDPESGKLIGERRFIGLYTSRAYATNPADVPFLRHKVAQVLERSGWPERSHAGKDLIHILTTLPRDDLFQASLDDLLNLSVGILHLQDRRQIRLFAREDAYGRYMSCLVYLPRDIFNTDLINRMQEILKKAFNAQEISFTTHLSESILAHIHFMVRMNPRLELNYNLSTIEKELIATSITWHESFFGAIHEYFGEERGSQLIRKYKSTFPAGYRESSAAREAVDDVVKIESLTDDKQLAINFFRPVGTDLTILRMKLFHHNVPVALSDALPILENLGLRVISEQSYYLNFSDGSQVWISDFSMTSSEHVDIEEKSVKAIFKDAFEKAWLQLVENDSMNKLVLLERLSWRDIALLRAYAKYFQQTLFTFSHNYVAETLVNNGKIVKMIVELFYARFNPEMTDTERGAQCVAIKDTIMNRLDGVESMDEDRILRRFVAAIDATLRTNYFQPDANDQAWPSVAFKFNPKLFPDLPRPLPDIEIFVYSTRFEGVHLRSDKVARGGIRWSDRREDFRTEILGLMKAQRVKNSIIVPAGAKGGFITKMLANYHSREEIQAEGVFCYQAFINGLLDCVDNIAADQIQRVPRTVCYDDDDPYLVVAADKGTATFSDIANKISSQRNYWMGDAFASGGSTGYDHKKMGITAKGAWVSAKRSFQELGVNLDQTEVTVVGIGDMAGDVFGNGMLISEKIKLVAAFNHQHIFVDPSPDPKASFEERIRLFNLPRSSWLDYSSELISNGGGVFHRSTKYINISPEIAALLDIGVGNLTPNELIAAILAAPADMIWNGGIGTFVRATSESNDDAGDRGNDLIRVTAEQLKARVVCEGGNLGLTQLARIEYDRLGGMIHTDFIDNSAGVDCSDHEVNIKIMFNEVMGNDEITIKQRNVLLRRMTGEVQELVLTHNYHQNCLIGRIDFTLKDKLNIFRYYMNHQEESGYLDRELECLPSDEELQRRCLANEGLTKPEISVLIAYSKNILKQKLLNSELLKQEYMDVFLKKAFPASLIRKYSSYILQHRLRDNIIMTQLSNQVVSDMGVTFVYQLQYETGADISTVTSAYIVASEVFNMSALLSEINSYDFKIDVDLIYQMTDDVVRLVRRASRWVLRNHPSSDIGLSISQYRKPIATLFGRLSRYILGEDRVNFACYSKQLIAGGVEQSTAQRVALTIAMYHSLNIVTVAEKIGQDISFVAKIYFHLVNRLDFIWFREYINKFPAHSQWSVMAQSSYKADLDAVQRALTVSVALFPTDMKTIPARMNAWLQKYNTLFGRWERIISHLRGSGSEDFAIISVAVREITELAKLVS